MTKIKTGDLQLGDVVQAFDGPFGTCTVKQIRDGMVTFFRPYVASENFSYTGGVICYVGIEEFSRPISDVGDFVLYRRGGHLH